MHYSLRSELSSLNHLEKMIQALEQEYGLEAELVHRITMALHEAITNAILHGNKLDPSKTVEVETLRDGNHLRITVTDQGEGFDPASLPDPLDEKNLLRSGGRGVFLIGQFTDELTFNDKGNQLCLIYHLMQH